MSEEFSDKNSSHITEPETATWTSPLEELLGNEAHQPDAHQPLAAFQQPDPTFGTPQQDSTLFPGQQSYPDTCAIRCQEFILDLYTGQHFDEATLVNEAEQHGWYVPQVGTSPDCIGNLLELHGIPVRRYEHASIFHLANELAQGHKVIIGVDSGELWNSNSTLEHLDDQLGIKGADHAVVVSGIDTTNPMEPRVIVSDPGTGDAVASYPMPQFLDAWQDSDFFMVTTTEPAPAHLPEMVNFDYDEGHIPEVVGVPYDQFVTYADNPSSWDFDLDQLLHPGREPEPDTTPEPSHHTDVPPPDYDSQLELDAWRDQLHSILDPTTFTNPYMASDDEPSGDDS
jgi:hypothetical protein